MPTPNIECHQAEDPDTLAKELALSVAEHLRQALIQRGHAFMVVSGGSTPIPFFKALATEALDWSCVTITLADERWLPHNHADSNERLVREHLLTGQAAKARFVPLKTHHEQVTQGLQHTERALAQLSWPADVVVLGMGGDGHTASLFPQSSELAQVLSVPAHSSLCMAVSAPSLPNVPVDRISLTPQALLSARQIFVHLTGASKHALLEQALGGDDVLAMPIRLVLHQSKTPCQIFISK